MGGPSGWTAGGGAECPGQMPGPELGPDKDFEPVPLELVESGIPHAIERQVAAGPDRLAIVDGERTWKYDAMNRAANRLARAIREAGPDRSRPVGVLLPHGADAILAILAALKAGKAYVAIDSAYPRERVEFLLEDSQADLLIAAEASPPVLRGGPPPGVTVLDVESAGDGFADGDLRLPLEPDAMAGLFYTSGSTGRPKGAIFPHRSMMHNKAVLANACHLCPADRVAQTVPFGLSASLNYFIMPFLVGASSHCFDVRKRGIGPLARWLRDEEITFFYAVPTVLRKLAAADRGEGFPSVRLLATGGETVLRHDVDLFREHFSDRCWLRLTLGMTEACGAVARMFINRTTPLPGDIVPAGYPVEDTEVLLLDRGAPSRAGRLHRRGGGAQSLHRRRILAPARADTQRGSCRTRTAGTGAST